MARRDITGAVDFPYLEGFAAGDTDVIDEVLALFEQQAQMWSPMLDSASEGWRDALHTVKGAARGGVGGSRGVSSPGRMACNPRALGVRPGRLGGVWTSPCSCMASAMPC